MNKEFEVYKVNAEGLNRMTVIAECFNECLDKLKSTCPESREFSITKTKLEEACFFAKKSVASNYKELN